MLRNFWTKLKKPITALAPMDGVTDTVFRRVVVSCGKPSVFFTEFTSVDGLCSAGKDRLMERLVFAPEERPIVAQIWGSDPDKFFEVAKMAARMEFDGIDINMGCPDRKVIKIGGGAALILNQELAGTIIAAAKKGAPKLPVSVKTRLGFEETVVERWLGFLLKQGLVALTIHGRTAREKSDPPANWGEIGKVVKLRDKLGANTLIIGNGDVKSYQEIREKMEKYKVDGVMIGRGIFHNPWIFNAKVKLDCIKPEERIKLLKKHVRLYQTVWGDSHKFAPLKKFVKTYINDFPGSSKLRNRLMLTESITELLGLLSKIS